MFKLIRRAQKGNDDAFLKLFQTYEQEIYKMAFIYVKNESDALDVVQETAYRSFKAIKKLKEPKYVKTWLIKIAINCSLDLLRKQKKVVQFSAEGEANVPENINENIELAVTIHDLMDLLDEAEKSVVLLKFYEEFTFKEISELLNIPLGTAKTTLYRALKKLRKNLKGADFYEE